jgi:hypothetical protein
MGRWKNINRTCGLAPGGDIQQFLIGDVVVVSPSMEDVIKDPFDDLTGLILDQMEMSDGFFMYEVLLGNEIHWFDQLELKLAKENKRRENK